MTYILQVVSVLNYKFGTFKTHYERSQFAIVTKTIAISSLLVKLIYMMSEKTENRMESGRQY